MNGANNLVALVRDAEGRLIDAHVRDDQCGGSAERQGRTLPVPDEFPTIALALDAAEPGDRVLVGPGTYTEQVEVKEDVALIGAGPGESILDGAGAAVKLVTIDNAQGVIISGFTFRGVSLGGTCGRPEDELACSGNHYPAAVFLSGVKENATCCEETSVFIFGNEFEGNAVGLMAYHHSPAVVVDNVFVGNDDAVVLNAGAEQMVFIERNLFLSNLGRDISTDASRPIVSSNVFCSGLDCRVEHVQRGLSSCNAAIGDVGCALITDGVNGDC